MPITKFVVYSDVGCECEIALALSSHHQHCLKNDSCQKVAEIISFSKHVCWTRSTRNYVVFVKMHVKSFTFSTHAVMCYIGNLCHMTSRRPRHYLHSRDASRLNCLHEAIPIAPAASDFPFRLLVDAVTHVFSVFRVCKVP